MKELTFTVLQSYIQIFSAFRLSKNLLLVKARKCIVGPWHKTSTSLKQFSVTVQSAKSAKFSVEINVP